MRGAISLDEPLGQKIGEVQSFQDEDGQLAYYKRL